MAVRRTLFGSWDGFLLKASSASIMCADEDGGELESLGAYPHGNLARDDLIWIWIAAQHAEMGMDLGTSAYRLSESG